jgi:outer membrane protein assembly factor BamB
MIYSHALYWPFDVGVTNNAAEVAGCLRKCTAEYLAVPGVNHGVYGAVNILTGKVAWTIPVTTTVPYSGVAVAGDLVFMGDETGLFYAASAATGEILWVFDAMTVPNAGGANASPAIYEINGVEYVVYGFGGSPLVAPGILGDAVIAFALPTATAAAAAKAKAK